MDFSRKAAAKLIVAVGKTLDKCMEFYKRVLTTHKKCQTSSTKRLQEFPGNEEHLKYLHHKLQEDELILQQVKGLNEKVVNNLVAQDAVSNCLLKDQLIFTPQRVEEIKSQLDVHEVLVGILEPMDFRTIAEDVVAWKQFMDGLARST